MHTSHYGRICPIETPEGPNIGLIVSLTTYARVNDFGFIETPYRVAGDGRVTDEVVFLDASREAEEVIAQANAKLGDSGELLDPLVTTRCRGDVLMSPNPEVTLMDISPSQMVSISAALVPFLEHDDANRALMGSNMQRQAVPLLRSERPLVGTGMEGVVARDSGSCLLAESAGVVRYADAERIIVAYEDGAAPDTGGVRAYELQKFHKSNQNSCFGQRPRVVNGQVVLAGDVLADGPGHQGRRAGPGQEPAGGLHALVRIQLRRLHSHLRARGPGGRLHVGPCGGVRGGGPGHQAGPRRDHPRHPQRERGDAPQPG